MIVYPVFAVGNLEDALDFYSSKMGFETMWKFADPPHRAGVAKTVWKFTWMLKKQALLPARQLFIFT